MKKGDFVLITAGSSSVGPAAIEIVKAEGAISIVTIRSASKRGELPSRSTGIAAVAPKQSRGFGPEPQF